MDRCQLNAFYDPKTHALVFPQFVDKGKMKYTSSSFDVVAHEAGHACLNAMIPSLNQTGRLDHKALHESFGDLSALFASLELASPAQLKAWLANPNSDTCIGGDLTGTCIRDPYDNVAIDCEEHSLSKPLTRFICNYVRHQ
jgi:Zn-dependent metalloprotease